MEAISTFAGWAGPGFVDGTGCWLIDEAGDRYFDASAGSGAVGLGHQHPIVIRALIEQAGKLIHTGCKVQSMSRRALMKKIAGLLPYSEATVLPTVIGTEAIEAAMKVARAHTKRRLIIGFEHSYHGKSTGALSLNWREELREHVVFDRSSTVLCPVPQIGMPEEKALALFEETVVQAAAQGSPPAAVIIEPIQSTEGVHILPPSFLKRVAEITRRANAVLIFDEIYTGFGRCGTMFYFEKVGVVPDLLVIGKALANGLPIGAVCGPAHIVNSLGSGIQTSTFSGNPLACGVAQHVIDHLIGEDIPKRAADMGRVLERELDQLHRETGVYGPPRGEGLMLGFDCIGEDGRPSKRKAAQFAKIALKERLIANVGGIEGASVRLTPPLTLTTDDVALLTNKLAKIASALRELG